MKEFVIKGSNIYLFDLYIKEVVRLMKFCGNWALLQKNGKIFAKLLTQLSEERKEIEDIYATKDEKGNIVTEIKLDQSGREIKVPIWLDPVAYENEINALVEKKITVELHEITVVGFDWPDTENCREALNFFTDTFVTMVDAPKAQPSLSGKRNKIRPIKS